MTAVIVAGPTLAAAREWAEAHLDAPGEVELICTRKALFGRRFYGAWVLPGTPQALVDEVERVAARTKNAMVWHVDPLAVS